MYPVRGVKAMPRTIKKASQRIQLRVEIILLLIDPAFATSLLPGTEKQLPSRSIIFKDVREGKREFLLDSG